MKVKRVIKFAEAFLKCAQQYEDVHKWFSDVTLAPEDVEEVPEKSVPQYKAHTKPAPPKPKKKDYIPAPAAPAGDIPDPRAQAMDSSLAWHGANNTPMFQAAVRAKEKYQRMGVDIPLGTAFALIGDHANRKGQMPAEAASKNRKIKKG